jgi:hypothetical protein
MNNKFDELSKSMAQSVTRRAALKKFGAGLAGMALACFGLVPKSEGGKSLPPRQGTVKTTRIARGTDRPPSAVTPRVCCIRSASLINLYVFEWMMKGKP